MEKQVSHLSRHPGFAGDLDVEHHASQPAACSGCGAQCYRVPRLRSRGLARAFQTMKREIQQCDPRLVEWNGELEKMRGTRGRRQAGAV